MLRLSVSSVDKNKSTLGFSFSSLAILSSTTRACSAGLFIAESVSIPITSLNSASDKLPMSFTNDLRSSILPASINESIKENIALASPFL